MLQPRLGEPLPAARPAFRPLRLPVPGSGDLRQFRDQLAGARFQPRILAVIDVPVAARLAHLRDQAGRLGPDQVEPGSLPFGYLIAVYPFPEPTTTYPEASDD